MLRLEHVFWAIGAFLLVVAVSCARDGRRAAAAFWALVGALVGAGDWITARAAEGVHWPGQLAGLAVLGLAALAPSVRGAPHREDDADARRASATRLGHRLFVPALAVPVLTLVVALASDRLRIGSTPLFGATSTTLVGVAFASLVAAVAALVTTRAPPRAALVEGARLLDTIGWAALLPMLLATLGGVLGATGVGTSIADLASAALPTDDRLLCVLAYGLGMALFTVILGNAFAAFPVMAAGIGLPLLVVRHGADPAVIGALGMLSGYCGTLLTPMAANFNVVPAALLELDDPNGVIRAQVPTALVLLAANLALMAALAFPA